MGWLKEYFRKNPFLLAHHPSCEYFSGHTLNFRGWRLCLGCFVIYPSAIVSLISLFVLSNFFTFSYMDMFYGALAFFGINLIRKLAFRDHLGIRAQIVFRIILALMLTAIWLAPNNEQIYFIGMFLAVAIGYNLFNGKKYIGTCKNCPQYDKFPKCEGLAPDK